MKYLFVAIAALLITGSARAELSASLVEKLKQAYAQSLDDVIHDLAAKKAVEQPAAAPVPISRVTRVMQNAAPLHKQVFKPQRAAALAGSGSGAPEVHMSGVIKQINSFKGADGKTHVTESVQTFGQPNRDRKLPDLAQLLAGGGSEQQQQPSSLFRGLLGMPFGRDIDEEEPTVVIKRLETPGENPMEGLLQSLMGGEPPKAKRVVRRRRVVRTRRRRVVRRRVVRRRRAPVDEPLHPDVAHVANLYGDFLDGEIERHANSAEPEDEQAYHHKVLAPKLITVREVGASQPQVSLLDDEDGRPEGLTISGRVRLGEDGDNPLNIIEQALSGLGAGAAGDDDEPVVMPLPAADQDEPIRIRIIGPVGGEQQSPLNGVLGSLIDQLEGNDVSEEPTPVVQHAVRHEVHHELHHSTTVHRIQHAPELSPSLASSPLQQLLQTLESGPAANDIEEDEQPAVVVRRVSTPLLNDNYGKPLLYGASSFPSIGHSANRKPFQPLDFMQLLAGGADGELPDPRNRNREPGVIVHRRRGGRPGQARLRAMLTQADLDQLIGGLLPNVVRRKRDLSKFRVA